MAMLPDHDQDGIPDVFQTPGATPPPSPPTDHLQVLKDLFASNDARLSY